MFSANEMIYPILIGVISTLALILLVLLICTYLRLKQQQKGVQQVKATQHELGTARENPDSGLYDEYQVYETQKVYNL